MSMDIKFEGITEFQDKLQDVIQKYPIETEKELKKLGNTLKRKSQDKTPKGHSGKLKKSYKLSTVNYSVKGNSYITMTNTSPHFHLVEKGHRQLDKHGNTVGKGYVPGKHMVENSVTELNGEMGVTLNIWMDKLLGGAK